MFKKSLLFVVVVIVFESFVHKFNTFSKQLQKGLSGVIFWIGRSFLLPLNDLCIVSNCKIEIAIISISNKLSFSLASELKFYTVMHFIKECDENYFGPSCKLLCNATCKGCNKTTGVCESGCYLGWEGIFCHEGNCLSYFFNNTSNLNKWLEIIWTISNIYFYLWAIRNDTDYLSCLELKRIKMLIYLRTYDGILNDHIIIKCLREWLYGWKICFKC